MSGLHYKKDGSLDMRYSSSRAAVASGYSGGGGSYSGYGGNSRSTWASSSGGSSGLHYKKDGTLDMRYSSSKAAVSSGSSTPLYGSGSSDLHYKKDGTLDMRYRSSQTAAAAAGNTKTSSPFFGAAGDLTDLHYKKDGTLDMRFKSSKALAEKFTKLNVSVPAIPSSIPLTKAGLPDMRTSAAKAWVKQQAQECGDSIPSWVPTMKDGAINFDKISPAVVKVLGEGNKKAVGIYNPEQRTDYYRDLLETNAIFEQALVEVRKQPLPPQPDSVILKNTQQLKRSLAQNQLQVLLPSISQISLTNLQLEPRVKIGEGGFGVVLKGSWNGRVVAVKKAHLDKLNRKEKIAFLNEVKILGYLGEHTNLIRLYAYVVDPPCLVLEFIELGSLSHLLHYVEDMEIQAKMTDGRIKQRIVLGVAHGMIQLHEVGVVHGDLKPQNILITNDFVAKITDFGLATLRGKITSSVASSTTCGDDHSVAGTGAYMAPELLDSTGPPELSSDVYSFAVLMNEVLSEEEPYSDQRANFYGRGAFGAANYAKLGKRPTIMATIPAAIKQFINWCWVKNPEERPSFKKIVSELQKPELKFPNFIS